jgi:hypothetical protein
VPLARFPEKLSGPQLPSPEARRKAMGLARFPEKLSGSQLPMARHGSTRSQSQNSCSNGQGECGLDAGNITLSIEGLSFVLQTNWIIGDATKNNIVILGKSGTIPDASSVKAAGKVVYIGKNSGASGNMFVVQ